MKILLEKSEKNIEASNLLLQEEYFETSIHCSYYSCIQLMSHILFNVFDINEYDFINSNENKKNGSHNSLLNEITKRFPSQSTNVYEFKNDFKIIKDYRIKADYRQQNILETDSIKSIDKATKINNKLKEIFLK